MHNVWILMIFSSICPLPTRCCWKICFYPNHISGATHCTIRVSYQTFFHIKSILLSVFAMLSSFRTLLFHFCACLLRRTLLQFVDLDVELLSSACHTDFPGSLLTCYNMLWSSCYNVNITTRTLLTRIGHIQQGIKMGVSALSQSFFWKCLSSSKQT